MARRITLDDRRQINELYYKYKNYAEVARQTGWSASTVRAYVDKNYAPIMEDQIVRFDPYTDMPEFDETIFEGVDNYGDLCNLTEDEMIELFELRKEILI